MLNVVYKHAFFCDDSKCRMNYLKYMCVKLKPVCTSLARGIRPPCMVTDRWLSHQISSQLT